MDSGHSNFLSGLILGGVVGLATGHLTLWSHSIAEVPVMEAESPYFDELGTDLGEKSAVLPPEYFQFLNEDGSDQTEVPSPFENAIAFETKAPDEEETSVEETKVAEASPPVVQIPLDPEQIEEPQPLAIPDAQSLKVHTAKSEQEIRELIDRELPNAPQSQKDVWFDSLKDLETDDVTGVLKMWKLFGGPASSMTSLNELQSPDTGDNSISSGQNDSNFKALVNQAIEIHQRNLLMQQTPGYCRTTPRFIEIQKSNGIAVKQLIQSVCMEEGKQVITGQPLDYFNVGAGMFQVTDPDGNVLYTRNGQFFINSKRQFALKIAETEYVLQPEITVPEAVDAIVVNNDRVDAVLEDVGHEIDTILMHIINQADLIAVGNGLFQATETANIFTQPANILKGSYEASNVNVEEETARIQQLRSLLD